MLTRNVSSVLLLLVMACAPRTHAQSLDTCGALPYLGTTPVGPELCVSLALENAASTPIYIRVPAGPGAAPLTISALSVGEYTVDTMTIGFVSGPTGMAIGMTGTVSRTAAGNDTLSIVALGGWGTPIQGGFGTITLFGSATGTSRTEAGAGVGYLSAAITAQDVTIAPFNQTALATTLGVGPIDIVTAPQPIQTNQDTVAVRMSVHFHLNNVGDSTTIPAGVGIAPDGVIPPTVDTGAGSEPHFECYDVKEHRPSKEERKVKLADQFDEVEKRVGRITKLCTPVDKNGEGIPDPELHLVCYRILKGHEPNQTVETKNQFGKFRMDVRKARELCVPSKKKHLYEEQEKEQDDGRPVR